MIKKKQKCKTVAQQALQKGGEHVNGEENVSMDGGAEVRVASLLFTFHNWQLSSYIFKMTITGKYEQRTFEPSQFAAKLNVRFSPCSSTKTTWHKVSHFAEFTQKTKKRKPENQIIELPFS